MKELFFAADLATLLRDDKHYGVAKNLSVSLRKLGISGFEQSNDIEQMYHTLVVHILDQRGESEPFLAGTFIYPEAIIALFKEHGLPTPGILLPASTAKSDAKKSFDPAQFERYFDIVCRNCGTVTDPLATVYRTPLGRLIFRTFLETRLSLGINATARYVLEHLKNFDSEKIVTSVNEDSVTWLAGESKEKLTSVQTIAKYVLNFNRELAPLL